MQIYLDSLDRNSTPGFFYEVIDMYACVPYALVLSDLGPILRAANFGRKYRFERLSDKAEATALCFPGCQPVNHQVVSKVTILRSSGLKPGVQLL